jgi:hypothetical protein
MALNPARVGFRYPAYRYDVGREHVREYALLTHVQDPRYTQDRPDAEPEPLPVPPTYVACIAGARAWNQVLTDPELGAHSRLMHAGQQFAFTRPVWVGDALICTPLIADIRTLRGLELLTLQVDCASLAGEPVVSSQARLVFFPEPA